MDFNLEVRKKQLASLKQYVQSSEDSVFALLQSLGWSAKKTLEKDDPKMTCTVNKNHLISYKSSAQHLEKCKLISSGYDLKEAFLSEPPENLEGTIKLTNKKKIEVINAAKGNSSSFKTAWNGHELDPLTSNRLTSTFSPDERLSFYDYSIKHTKAPPKPEEFTLDLPESKDTNGKTESLKDKLAQERDAKRRRVKYKSVHTSKKSQIEITRELINNQMELYAQWIQKKQKQERRRDKDVSNKTGQINANGQYHFIESLTTTRHEEPDGQHIKSQNNEGWAQNTDYSQYYTDNGQQGVIHDWSHLYQGATDVYPDLDQCPVAEGTYVDPLSIETTQQNFQGASDASVENQSSKIYSGYSQSYSKSAYLQEEIPIIKDKENDKNGHFIDYSSNSKKRSYKEREHARVKSKSPIRSRSREKDGSRRRENVRKEHRSREKKHKDKRH